jgi:hypothetical protein
MCGLPDLNEAWSGQGGWVDAPGLSPAAAFPHRNSGIGTAGALPDGVAVCIWSLLK